MKGRILIVIIISLLVGLCVGLSGCSKKELGADLKEWEIKPELKLKADKDKILYNEEIDDIRCNENGLECKNLGKIKKYLYVSDKKVKDEKLEKDGKSYDVYKRTKNAVIYKVDKPKDLLGATEGEKEYFVGKFYTGNPFYEDEAGDWYETETSTTTIEAFIEQTATSTDIILGASGDPVYSGNGDGYTITTNNSWAVCHDNSNSASAAIVGNYYSAAENTGSSPTYQLTRMFAPFNTSVIPSGSTIDSAKVYFYDRGISSGSNSIALVQTRQASVSNLVVGDHDECGESLSLGWSNSKETDIIEGAERLSSFSAGYVFWTLNATGLSWIATDGQTKPATGPSAGYTLLGLRMDNDIDNATPPASPRAYRLFWSSEQTGTTQDPYLEVFYSAGAAPTVKQTADILLFDF